MAIKPILFNAEMVRAILDGRKTCTRRVVKYKYDNTQMEVKTDKYGSRLIEIQCDVEGETYGKNSDGSTWRRLRPFIEKKPPYRRGDVLYVREAWCKYGKLDYFDQVIDGTEKYYYAADGANPTSYNTFLVQRDGYDEYKDTPVWHPSIHMPKEAARIWLKATDVRVERLQEITDEQAKREGIQRDECPTGFTWKQETDMHNCYTTPIGAMQALWNFTIKKSDLDRYGWNANPWVWAIEFERCEKPEGEN